MGLDGPSFYDDDGRLRDVQRHRGRDETPNDTMEKPEICWT